METADECLHTAEQAIRQGHAHDALVVLRQLIANQPSHSPGLALMAVAHALMGEDVETRTAVERATALAPRDPQIRSRAYIAFARLRDVERARAQLAYFVELEPDNAQAREQLKKMGGPPPGLTPLPPAEKVVVWYDGGGHALADGGDLDDEKEPPPGPNVIECPECEKRTPKGWTCQHCGVALPRPV